MPIYLPEKKKKEVEESESTVLRILELLNRPAKAAMGGIRAFTDPKETRSFAPIKRAYENFVGDKRDTGKAVAQDLGMKGIAASMVGGIGDVVADPLNLLMIGAVDDAVRRGLRAASNATIKPAAKTIASKSPQFLKNAGNELLDTVTEGVRWSVNPFFRMPEEIARTGRLNQAAQRSAPQRVLEDVMKRGWGSGQPWKGEMTFASLSPTDQAIIAKHPQYSAATADSLAKGFITDKLQKMIDQVRQQETVEAFQNFISNPGHKKFLTYAPSPKHTQIAQIKQFPTKNLPGPTTWQYVPDDLLEALLPAHRGKRTSMGKYWDKGMDMWRSGVTKWNIPFHVTNDIGNKYNIFADTGLNPVTVKRSGKLLRGQGVIENAQQLVHSPQEILKALKKFDVDHGLQQHATYFGDDLESTAQSVREAIYGRQPSTGKFGKVKDVFKGVSEFIDTKISDPIERNPRVGLVVEQLRKLTPGIKAREQELLSMGASPADAAKFARQEALEKSVIQTKDTMFDYRELTPREQVLRQVAAPFYCVPETTTALTRQGWKHYKDITLKDELLTYNVEKDCLEWQVPEEIASFDYSDILSTLNNTRHKIVFTPEHRWVVKNYKKKTLIKKAVKINSGDKLIVTAPLTTQEDSLLTPEQAALLGWILTDGYFRVRGNYLEAVLYQSPKKWTYQRVLAVAGGKPRKPHPDTGVVAVPVRRERLEELRQYLVGRKKTTHDWVDVVTHLNRDALEAMYEAMYQADGTTVEHRTHDFFACQLDGVARTFEVLATLLGKRVVRSRKGFYVSSRRYLKIASCERSEEFYEGIVWCPRTPNGTWVMKQGNFVTITGNTFTRKNIPVQVRSIIKRPWFPAHVGKARETIENFSEDTGVRIDPSLIPDWLDEGVQLPFNYDKQPVFLRNKLPLMDLAYLDPTNPETIRQARSMVGPLPKAASEVIFNMNFNNPQRKLMDQRGFSTPVAAPEWLQAIPESVGSLFMDVHRDPVDKRLRQYKIPVWASLLTRDIPLNTQARGARGMADMTGLGGDVKDPLSALAFLGLPITAQNRKYLERTRTARRMEDKKQKGMERKERGRLIKKSAIDRILEGEFD